MKDILSGIKLFIRNVWMLLAADPLCRLIGFMPRCLGVLQILEG